jgi:hypothetical protein
MKGKFAKTRPDSRFANGPISAAAQGPTAAAPKAIESKPTAAVGRPVAVPALQEEIDDEIPA